MALHMDAEPCKPHTKEFVGICGTPLRKALEHIAPPKLGCGDMAYDVVAPYAGCDMVCTLSDMRAPEAARLARQRGCTARRLRRHCQWDFSLCKIPTLCITSQNAHRGVGLP